MNRKINVVNTYGKYVQFEDDWLRHYDYVITPSWPDVVFLVVRVEFFQVSETKIAIPEHGNTITYNTGKDVPKALYAITPEKIHFSVVPQIGTVFETIPLQHEP